MEVNITQEQGQVPVTILQVKGRVNMGNAEELEKKVREAYERGAANILLDLSETESMTSAGLRALLYAYKLIDGRSTTSPKSSHFKLLNPTPEVFRVLKLAGFDTYLDIRQDRQEAIASFED